MQPRKQTETLTKVRARSQSDKTGADGEVNMF